MKRKHARILDWSIREATHPEWNIRKGSLGLEHPGKVRIGVFRAASRGEGGGSRKKRRGEHKQEQDAEESDRRGQDGVAAEGRDERKGGGGGGNAKTQRGRLRRQNKEGAKRRKVKQCGKESAEEYPSGYTPSPCAHLVPSFILLELIIHLKMIKMKILKLNLIHHASNFSVILVPNLWLGACCRCRARVCRCFCMSPQLFARNIFSQKIRRTKINFVVR